MDRLGRTRIGLRAITGMTLLGAGLALAQSPSSLTSPAAPAIVPAASAPARASAKKPTVDELLATCKPAPFDFTDARIPEIMAYIAQQYDLQIINNYELTDRITMKEMGSLAPREAINILNSAIMPRGYTFAESVRGDPPKVVLTVVPTRVDAGKLIPFFYGNDPAMIPEGDERRTQVLTLHAVDPGKAREMILSVVGAQAEIQVNVSTRTIVITDTATHVHTAAALLQVLEKQAAEKKQEPATQ